MTKPEIRIFEGLEPLSWAAATSLEEQARVKVIENKPFSVALSGGSTPRSLYELLGSPTFAGRVRWPNVHFFQVDERCVPPDDPQSNYRLILESFWNRRRCRGTIFIAWRPSVPTANKPRATMRHNWRAFCVPRPGSGRAWTWCSSASAPTDIRPRCFPVVRRSRNARHGWCPTFVPELNSFRMTLTFPVLNAAANVIFLVSGAEKAEVVRDVLEGPEGRFPAQFVQPSRGRLSWFLDEGAAHLLKRQGTGNREQGNRE